MNVEDMKKILKGISEDNIEFDDPHVKLRCKENNTTKDKIIQILLHEVDRLI